MSRLIRLKTDGEVSYPLLRGWELLYNGTNTASIELDINVNNYTMLCFFISNNSTTIGTPIIIPLFNRSNLLRGVGANSTTNQMELFACRGTFSNKKITMTDFQYVYLKSTNTIEFSSTTYTGFSVLYGLR